VIILQQIQGNKKGTVLPHQQIQETGREQCYLISRSMKGDFVE
jgi:hypothetical protein